MRCFWLASFIVSSFTGTALQADSNAFRLEMCVDRHNTGWSFYCHEPEPEPEPEVVDPVVAPPSDVENEMTATETIMAFRAEVDEIKHRAVLDPTRENVLAYMEINKLIADKAGLFTDQWQRVLYETPGLNAALDRPLASAGISVFEDQMNAVRAETFVNVASTSGIIFVFDDDAVCGLCRVQAEVLRGLEAQYGVSILAVSKDGGSNALYQQASYSPTRLQEVGLDEYPTPTLALVDPNTKEVSVIGSGLITAEDILQRVYVVTQLELGERY